MIKQVLKNFTANETFRLIATGTACVLLASCTTSQLFPNTKKILPELVVPYTVPKVAETEVVKVARQRFVDKNYPAALLYYEEALKLYPDNEKLLLAYAASADMSGKFSLSEKAYRQYARYFGKNFHYFNNYGYSMILRGDYQKAQKYLIEASRLYPSSIVVRNNLTLLNRVQSI